MNAIFVNEISTTMNEQEEKNFARIEEAIRYIQENFKEQPTLKQIAKSVHLSPFHFQKMFTDWAGVSPKKFLQYISVQHAKTVLNDSPKNLIETSLETGLSSTGRLHDLFVKIEGMTPGEYKNSGENLTINYSFAETLFGRILVASTRKGICYMAFSEEETTALQILKERFANAKFTCQTDKIQQNVLQIYQEDWSKMDEIKLHLKGTDFQLKVWETLLKIPIGGLTTYGNLAMKIGNKNAARAVGTAIGSNPIAYLIPCHRVIQATGIIGGYRWGTARKTAIIGWEAAKIDSTETTNL